MAVMNKKTLLEYLSTKTYAADWGAVFAFDRTVINETLAREFVYNSENFGFYPPFSESFTAEDGIYQISNLQFGVPEISFRESKLGSQRIILRVPVTAGEMSLVIDSAISPSYLSSMRRFDTGHGYWIEFTLSVGQESGEIDYRGRLVINLSEGSLTTNLPNSRQLIEPLTLYFSRIGNTSGKLVLGHVDISSNDPLAPKSFFMSAQRAPENGEDEGALLVFMQLNANNDPGTLPIEGSDFPYLIPNDSNNGVSLYHSTCLISERLLDLVSDNDVSLLSKAFFQDGFTFDPESMTGIVPRDKVYFGKIATSDAIISPVSVEVGGQKDVQFTLRRKDGTTINNVEWNARSLYLPTYSGVITDAGKYTSADVSSIAGSALPVAISATWTDNAVKKTRSANVLVRNSILSVEPQISVSNADQKVILTVSDTSASALSWSITPEGMGTITKGDTPGQYIYTSPSAVQSEPVSYVTVSAKRSDGVSASANIILINSRITSELSPAYIPSYSFNEALVFTATDYQEGDQCRWMLFGEGEIVESEEGEAGSQITYIPPGFATNPCSVIVLTLVYGGRAMIGYSVINHSLKFSSLPTWNDLTSFTVKVLGSPHAYSNGYQQIPVLITVETTPVNVGGSQLTIPLSDAELSTMVLVDRISNQKVSFLHHSLEGIAERDTVSWAMSRRKNRFRYSTLQRSESTSGDVSYPKAEGAIRYVEAYIHFKGEELREREFYAQFTSSSNAVWSSIDKNWSPASISLNTSRVPVYPRENYSFTRTRVEQFPSIDPIGDDIFSYYLKSVDYWELKCMKDTVVLVPFLTVKTEDNSSTIRWESDKLRETFFSYTGTCLMPGRLADGVSVPDGLTFDSNLYLLNKKQGRSISTGFPGNKKPDAGNLCISLHRTDEMPYWYDKMSGNVHEHFRLHLDPDVKYSIVDEDGNRHYLSVGFPAPTLLDNRNYLEFSIIPQANVSSQEDKSNVGATQGGGVPDVVCNVTGSAGDTYQISVRITPALQSNNNAVNIDVCPLGSPLPAAPDASGNIVFYDEQNKPGTFPVPASGTKKSWDLKESDTPFVTDTARKFDYGNIPSATLITLYDERPDGDNNYTIKLRTTRQPTSLDLGDLLQMSVFGTYAPGDIIRPGMQLIEVIKTIANPNYFDSLSYISIDASADAE